MSTFSPVFVNYSASATVAHGGSYIPPFATATGGGGGSGSSPTTIANNPNPTTPAFLDDYQWVFTYLVIHKMSPTSYRYMYFLWFAVVLMLIIVALLHWTGSRGGVIGAAWNKWALRRRTWRKRHSLQAARRSGKPHKQPFSFPSNAQLLSLLLLFVVPAILCTVGPDYIAPATGTFDLVNNLTRRDTLNELNLFRRGTPVTATNSQPAYTIPKAWWTAGGRTGMIAFALVPLCILFSLKAPPFAILAIPFLTQIHFDKLARLHRWSGRIIWLITTIHIVTWGIQLANDRRGGWSTNNAWSYVWLYSLFIYGWVGYVALTLLVLLSFDFFRTRYYELFYLAHIILVPVTLVFSALHFPPIWGWCWGSLALWVAERTYRFIRWSWLNGVFGMPARSVNSSATRLSEKADLNRWEMGVRRQQNSNSQHPDKVQFHVRRPDMPRLHSDAPSDLGTASTHKRDPSSLSDGHTPSRRVWGSVDTSSSSAELVPGYRPISPSAGSPASPVYPPSPPGSSGLPPPGYAHTVLLPGRTIRMRLVTPRPFTWAPGQHVLLCVPSISKFTTHPFTIMSACDEEAGDNRVMDILIRAKKGFTKDLWDEVRRLSTAYAFGSDVEKGGKSRRGTLLRAYVDGPFGSAVRARWGQYSTVVIVTGGSGVSFGVSVLEYLCLCMSGRDGRTLGGQPGAFGSGGFQTTRIRFVWLVREYSHIQWCASALRRCISLVPATALQVDIFVSNFVGVGGPQTHGLASRDRLDGELQPPVPGFVKSERRRSASADSIAESEMTTNSFIDLYYAAGGRDPPDGEDPSTGILGHEEHVLDLTNFDGEDDTRLPGEAQLSVKVKKEGKLRRAQSRKKAAARAAKAELDAKSMITTELDAKSVAAASSARGRNRMSIVIEPPPPGALVPTGAASPRPISQEIYAASDAWRGDLLSPTPATPFTGLDPNTPTARLVPSPRDGFSPLPADTKRLSNFGELPDRGLSPSPSGFDLQTPTGDRRSFLGGVGSDSVHDLMLRGRDAEEPQLEMDEDEAEDLNFIAELAHPGKPRLDRILADEVERSRGALTVACCGPTSLNAVMRKVVAAQISPSRIWRGDMRGSISLTTEEFEW